MLCLKQRSGRVSQITSAAAAAAAEVSQQVERPTVKKSGEKARLDLLTRFRPHQKKGQNEIKTKHVSSIKSEKRTPFSLSASFKCEHRLLIP